MAKCSCGNCLHMKKKTDVETDPESRTVFERTTCADCGKWIGDKLLD